MRSPLKTAVSFRSRSTVSLASLTFREGGARILCQTDAQGFTKTGVDRSPPLSSSLPPLRRNTRLSLFSIAAYGDGGAIMVLTGVHMGSVQVFPAVFANFFLSVASFFFMVLSSCLGRIDCQFLFAHCRMAPRKAGSFTSLLIRYPGRCIWGLNSILSCLFIVLMAAPPFQVLSFFR